jgi:hypothetical protein
VKGDGASKRTIVTTWARIEARSYEDAVQLLEWLLDRPSTLVQSGEHEWSIYVAADGPEVPELISGCGVAPNRVTFVESAEPFGVTASSDFADEQAVPGRVRRSR